ncbi:hypothetical protein Scep_030946 [Stephania cephalantha]|uniref:protoporphyrinogen oxidase n=1 Tax=Stephania cephalantha TaxID=152367 RepID=A0AAP0E0L2_9MAGN
MAVIPMANSRPLLARHAFPHTNSPPHWVALASPTSRSTRFRCSIAKETPPSKSKLGEGDPKLDFDCVVVGAGISGLCVAQALSSHKLNSPNMNVIVTEASDRVGGNITTVEKEGYLWEEGPNSFQPSDSVLSAVKDSGLLDDLVLGDPTAPRFVFWDGKLRPVPSKPLDLPFFDLMTFSGKLRAGFGAFGFRPPPPDHEESVEEFVRRNLGDQVFERLIEPFCSGVYAGDPAKLSIKAAFGKVWKLEQNGGSLVGGAFKAIQGRNKNPKPLRDPQLPKPKGQTVGSFSKGLCMLPDAISRRLGSKVRLSWKLSSIEKLSKGGYNLTYETPEGLISVQTKVVVMTIPSHVASNLLRPLSNAAADALSKFYYPPVAVVSISYPKEAIREDCLIAGELKGFGQLHPRSQGVETLGTIYSSSLFPNRAPPGRVLLLNFIGGATNVGILNKTDGELVEAVDRDLRKMLIKRNAKDPMALGVRVWPQAIPQFLVGHLDLVDAAQSGLRDNGLGGVFLRGNYVSGVALGRCVEGAYETAAEVYNYLSVYNFIRVRDCFGLAQTEMYSNVSVIEDREVSRSRLVRPGSPSTITTPRGRLDKGRRKLRMRGMIESERLGEISPPSSFVEWEREVEDAGGRTPGSPIGGTPVSKRKHDDDDSSTRRVESGFESSHPQKRPPLLKRKKGKTGGGLCVEGCTMRLSGMKTFWREVLGSSFEAVKNAVHCPEKQEGTSFKEWLTLPDMGLLVSTAFNVILVNLSHGSASTFLPLRSTPPSSLHNRLIIAMANEMNIHWVRCDLRVNAPHCHPYIHRGIGTLKTAPKVGEMDSFFETSRPLQLPMMKPPYLL